MGSEKSPKSSGSLGARLLIILYSSGIVMLGLYPIQREYGSFWNFVDKKIVNGRLDTNPGTAFNDFPRRDKAVERQQQSREKVSWFSRKLAELRDYSISSRESRARMEWPEAKKVPVNKNSQRGKTSTAREDDFGKTATPDVDHLSTKDRNELDSLFDKLP